MALRAVYLSNLKSTKLIFVTKNGNSSSHKYIDKAGSEAVLEARKIYNKNCNSKDPTLPINLPTCPCPPSCLAAFSSAA
jgi:hypothetical protein